MSDLLPFDGGPTRVRRWDLSPLADAMRSAVEVAVPLIDEFNSFVEHLRAAGLVPPAVPTDARERALAHVRTRNTGPAQQQRAPRRIDPRRSR